MPVKPGRYTLHSITHRDTPRPTPENEFLTPQEIAQGFASLLAPITAAFFSLALWRFGQDLGLTRSFFITEGPLSHWQPWLALSGLLFAFGIYLNRPKPT